MENRFSEEVVKKLLIAEMNEATETIVYSKLAKTAKDEGSAKSLEDISKDEARHFAFFESLTGKKAAPSKWKIFKYYWTARIFGLTFGIKLMENGEAGAQINYKSLEKDVPGLAGIIEDENKHELKLIELIKDERLQYIGSVVLGLSDALVELTGMLAGLTLAMQNTRLVAMAGLITGVAAALSMAASQYLAVKSAEEENAMKSAIYTGITYIFTVILLVCPYLIFKNYFISLLFTMIFAIIEIIIFNYYISVAKNLSFKKKFWEMTIISLSVAALSFGIGYLVKIWLNVNV
jgi:vacuolar iron transporter family protein